MFRLAIPLLALAATLPAWAQNNYPTAERVSYVHTCMSEHPGNHYEMLNKCSCVLDKLAEQLTLEQFVSLSTASNATSIGGERGAYIRDTESLQQDIRRFRQMQATAKKACFINLDAR